MSDYDRIATAIRYITAQADRQPTLDAIAAQVHLSPYHFQRLFSRWAGVSPKRYLQTLTVERAKRLLRSSMPLLEVSASLGLSSGSRLHDHFVQLEAMTPGEYKGQGAGLLLDHAVLDTPFGRAFLAATPRGICNFSFLDANDPDGPLAELLQAWPQARVRTNRPRLNAMVKAMFDVRRKPDRPLSLHVRGTNFQVSVWRALLRVSPATVTSYSRLAKAVGSPKAARAVGAAVGANPVAFLIPCHRVIQESGQLGGYHWGVTRKQALLAWEQAGNDS